MILGGGEYKSVLLAPGRQNSVCHQVISYSLMQSSLTEIILFSRNLPSRPYLPEVMWMWKIRVEGVALLAHVQRDLVG